MLKNKNDITSYSVGQIFFVVILLSKFETIELIIGASILFNWFNLLPVRLINSLLNISLYCSSFLKKLSISSAFCLLVSTGLDSS